MSEKRVLVVDDSIVIVKSLSFMLNKEAYQVFTASNGEEGVQKIRKHRPQVVFSDIMMPQMDGYELCQQVKQDPDLKNTYVILLTAKGEVSDREKGLAVGADQFLTKPFSPSKVSSLIREVFATLEEQGMV